MTSFKHIELSVENHIARLVFNRSSQLNAMNSEMMNEIIEALRCIDDDEQIKVGIITGKGRAFMAGADIKEYGAFTDKEFLSFTENGRHVYATIEGSRIPFIASVNGFALGGGFEIALSCDFIIASESAKLGLPEVHLGLIPGGGGVNRLIQKLGINRVKEIAFLGGSYSAQVLYDWGIVYKFTGDEELQAETNQLAERLLRRPGGSIAALKQMLQPSNYEKPIKDRFGLETNLLFELYKGSEARVLIKKFIEKNR